MNNIYYCYVESDTLSATDIFNGMTQAEARLLVEEELNGVRRDLVQLAANSTQPSKSWVGFRIGQSNMTKACEMMRLYCDHFHTSYFHKPNPDYGVWVDYEHQPLITSEEVDGLLARHQVQPVNPSFWTEKEAAGVSDLELMLEIRKSLYAHMSLVKLGFLETRSLHIATDLSIYSELMKRISN